MSQALFAETIFGQAIAINDVNRRAEFLDRACRGDSTLRGELQRLVEDHFRAGDFLKSARLPPDATTAATESIGTQIGPYKLLEQIGEGGMGLVYVAEQTEPVRRRVALKVIKPGLDTRQVIARFEAERQALAMMDHPNIAKVLDAGATESGRPYFVMELVRGLPITEYSDKARLSPRRRLELFVKVCQAVQHAHQKGVIHRDLKPSNILVTLHDGTPVPKVIDFGVAKAMGQQLTERTIYTAHTQLVGTPLYMSPEQAELSGLDVDTRSDVYSLGVLLYELLTGHTPFDQATLSKAGFDEMRRIIREDEPPRPSARVSTLNAQAVSTVSQHRGLDERQLSRTLRGELDWIVMKSLEKDRTRRYESASALAADLQRYLADEAVQACPPSAVYRLQKYLRRHKGGVAAGGLVALLLGLTMAFGGMMYVQRANAQRQIVQQIQQALAAARTAIEADDLVLAGHRISDATTRIGTHRSVLLGAAADIDKLSAELESRRADRERFESFIRLASDAQSSMAYSKESFADAAVPGDQTAHAALEVFGVLRDPDWIERLNRSHLTPGQKSRVHETAYETLVSLADYGVRWNRGGKATGKYQESLEQLDRARSFHEPTRAWWFVRREAHKQLKDEQAVNEDNQRFQAIEAKTAWDHYLPGHTAGWDGDLDEAIRAYRAALRVQPDHFNSLFFLAERLAADKINRPSEALGYYAACIALRPSHVFAHTSRANCYRKLGQLAEAEADFTAAVAFAKGEYNCLVAYCERFRFYNELGRVKEAEQDANQCIAIGEKILSSGKAGDRAAWMKNNLGYFYSITGKLAESEAILTDMLAESAAATPKRGIAAAMNNLAGLYRRSKNFQKAETLYRDSIALSQKDPGPDDPLTLSSMANLGFTLIEQGKHPEAELLLGECLARSERTRPDSWQTFRVKSLLGGALVGRAIDLGATDSAAAKTKLTEAEPLLVDGYVGLKAREELIHIDAKNCLIETLQRLVALYTAWDKPDEATKWQKELDAKTDNAPATSPNP